MAEAIRAYAQETNRLNQERRAQGEQDRKALDKIERAIAGIMAAIEDGLYQPSMKARMEDLERQKAEITERLALAPTDVPDLHPNIATLYGKRVEQLTQALADHKDGRPAAEALRSLIREIVLTPGDKRGEVHAELRGELFGILEFAKPDRNQKSDDVMTKGVAGPRNQIRKTARLSAGRFAFAACRARFIRACKGGEPPQLDRERKSSPVPATSFGINPQQSRMVAGVFFDAGVTCSSTFQPALPGHEFLLSINSHGFPTPPSAVSRARDAIPSQQPTP
ncbi:MULTISPECIES: hypothetical protein [unclassified Mesorhizobium]|uniref:hypothetical protein n=1 Tax=unclassified Mesorhizobium TaxID=325217 RepID=UPI001FE1EBF0|nr:MULTISPECIES: hypothetical protein [unclassified Mesorhizobium]